MPIKEESCCFFLEVALLDHDLRVGIIQRQQLLRLLELRRAEEVLPGTADLVFDLAEDGVVNGLIRTFLELFLR